MIPVLTDGEVTLRAHRPSDVDEMVVHCTDSESISWTDLPLVYTREDAVRYATETMPNGWATRSEWGFAVQARGFAGSVSLRLRGDGIADIAYGLHPAARGRGVGTRAVKLLLDRGFEQPEIDLLDRHPARGRQPRTEDTVAPPAGAGDRPAAPAPGAGFGRGPDG